MRYNIFNVALYVRITMICCRTEFFVTVTEGLSAEVIAQAERFGANDLSVLRQIKLNRY